MRKEIPIPFPLLKEQQIIFDRFRDIMYFNKKQKIKNLITEKSIKEINTFKNKNSKIKNNIVNQEQQQPFTNLSNI